MKPTARLPTRIRHLLLAFTTFTIGLHASSTDVMPPVGAVSMTAPANSDTVLSLSCSRAAVYSGVISQISGNTVSVSDSPAWPTNRFVRNSPSQPDTFYVQFRTGAAAGHFYTVTGNGPASLNLDPNGENMSVASGDKFDLIPYWSLGTAYPSSNAGKSFSASTSALLRKTELLFLDPTFVGTNPAPATTFYYLNGAWRKVGQPTTASFNDTVLVPDTYFIQRNKTDATKLTNSGAVATGTLATLIISGAGTAQQDNAVALRFAGTVTLAQSNLVQSGAFQASTSALLRKDQLLVFDNTTIGTNKAPAVTYYYLNGAWRKVGSAVSLDFGNDPVFTPGTGAIVRKAGTGAAAQQSFWVYAVTGL